MPRTPNIDCLDCNKPLYRRPGALHKGLKPLCTSCHSRRVATAHADKLWNEYIARWKAGLETGSRPKNKEVSTYVRRYLFKKYQNKCVLCSWSEVNPTSNKIPLQIDHIDGDYSNNKEDNLRLLCPNCHSLTPTFMALNKGKGRAYRYN